MYEATLEFWKDIDFYRSGQCGQLYAVLILMGTSLCIQFKYIFVSLCM